MTAILFFIAVFVTVAALIYSGLKLIEPQEDPLGDRIEQLQTNTLGVTARGKRRRSADGGFLNKILYIVSNLGGEEWLKDIEKELNQAGIRNKEAVAFYVIFNIMFFVVLMLAMLYLQRDNPISNKLGGVAAAGLLGYLIPQQVLHKLVRRYRAKLQEALPDTVDLLGIVLGTGLALDQAMTRVSEEMQFIYPELASEFYTVVMQVKAGQERSKAFQQLVRRTGIEDIKSLAAMIIQSERFGTSLSQALNVYAEALRMRRKLRAEAMVAKAGIKMLFPIVLFILPALFVVALVPGLLSALRDLRGGIGGSR
jgi:tight adherence protein C